MSGHPILDFIGEELWALRRQTLDSLTGVVMRHVRGAKLSADQVEDIKSARADGGADHPRLERGYELRGNVAVIPIRGVIAKYASQVNGSSQPRGTAAETVLRGLRAALSDDAVKGILLNIDSPGGTVSGVPALAEEIFAASGEKPIWAYSQDLMASAAYWIGSQAERIYAGQAADIGSIGVYAAVVDSSRAAEADGVQVHVVKAGEHKGAFVPGAAVTEADLETLQRHVDETRELFVEAIARGRKADAAQIATLANGDTWRADRALERELIDGVRSFEGTLAAMQDHVSRTVFGAQGGESLGDGNREEEMADHDQGQEPQATPAAPSLEGATLEQLQAAHPQLIEQLLQQGAAQERARIDEIQESALAGQEDLAAELIQNGATPDEARKRFLADMKGRNAAAASELLEDAPQPVGADPEPDAPQSYREPSGDELAALSDDQVAARAASDWQEHMDTLQAEGFYAVGSYEGHLRALRAKAQGQVL
jgi:signal peptide peptidase SppA